MAKEKYTIYQRLSNLFGPDGDIQQRPSSNNYNIGNEVLIKTQDKQEYEVAKLQAQQQKYLGQMWRKVDGEMFQQSMHYEVTRIGSYSDFESMEFYPEISAALDIFMEESTTPNSKGKILNVYSESKRVRRVLEDLFFNRLDIHTNLPMWTRNLCKYGDDFVLLNTNDTLGITGCKQMPNFEMERREGDIYNAMVGARDVISGNDNKQSNKVKFYWKGRDMVFNSWQIAHFRLLGDDRKLPYGTCLKGDTRINTEFGVEEIKDIEIGTKVWSFNIKTQQKELSPILDKVMSGTKEVFKISTRHNFIDASKEHRILVATEVGEFIYKNVGDLKLGDLLVLNKNERTNKQIKIDKTQPLENKNGWFNDINSIPDYVNEEFAQLFGFLIGDGWIPTHNDQVCFALGTDIETNEYYINLLEKFSNKTHIKTNNEQVHVNSKLLSTILTRMGFGGKSYEKRIPNWVFEMDLDFQKAFVSGLMDANGWASRDQWTIALHIELNNKPLIEDLKILLQRIGYKSGSIRSRVRKAPIIEGRQIKTVRESHLITFFDSYLFQMKKYKFKNRKTDNFVLEPIQSIESIGEYETYDIYVENENHNFYANNIIVHNSVLEKARRIWKQLLLSEDAMLIYRVTRAPERRIYKVYVGNIDDQDVEPYVNEIANRFKRRPVIDPQTGQIDLRYNQLAQDQDFFIPVRDEQAPNPIDTLPGATNLSEIADIEYLQRKLFTALRVPKTFLGFEEAVGEGKNLALQDIRFSRTINRIQQAIIMELNKIAIIHLYLLGFTDELDNFILTLNNPSTQAEMLKIEHTQAKITLYNEAVRDSGNGFAAMSMTRGKRDILGWSDEEIKQDLLEQRMEKAAAAELEKTAKIIKHTGLFDKVDNIYGDPNYDPEAETTEKAGEGGDTSPAGGGGFGGGSPDFGAEGSEELDFGEEGEEGAEGGEEVPTEELDFGAEEIPAEEVGPAESIKRVQNIINEQKDILQKKLDNRTAKYQTKFINKLTESILPEDSLMEETTKIIDKGLKINENFDSMIDDIDKILKEKK